MSPPPADPATFAGTRRFQVLGPLGVGAMCVVHRARDRELGDIVALKTLKHLDSDSLYRLKQEFRALSAFDHPNLVSFYELLHSDDGWFVTMELVEGVDFLSWSRGKEEGARSVARTQSTWRSATDLRFARSAPAGKALTDDNAITEAIEALPESTLPDLLHLRSSLRQLAEGVSALHAGGRIHRDLKPSNVLVTDAGRVVILDFGLVADIDQDYTEGTLHQSIAGSAAYMSPEQTVGVPLTEASDWYAVGVMLYEGLTGRWPFSGSLYQILTVKNATDPPAPSTLLDGVPPDLDELCMALLQRDPEARPSGGEVLATLRSQEPGRAAPRLLVPFRFREREQAQLVAAYRYVAEGQPACVIVRGSRGSGKTQLVREFIKELNRRGRQVALKGRCFEWERVRYKAMDALIDNMARALRRASTDLIQDLAREDLGWLAALFPVVARADALDILPRDPAQVPDDELVRQAMEQLDRVFARLCRDEPMVAFIDDVHWGDPESAQALAALTARPGRRLMLICTVDVDAPSPFLSWLLPQLSRAGVSTGQIDLEPLPPEPTVRLAAEMLGVEADTDEARQVAHASGGVPGRIRELVRQRVSAEAQDDEAELDEVRIADIEGLPPPPRRLLELLCLAQAPVPTEVAVVGAQLGDQAVNAVSALRAHRLCDVSGATGEALGVSSRSVTDFVVDHMSDADRRRHHLALATGLEQTGSADPSSLCTHYAGAGDLQRAGTVAWIGANRALEERDWGRGEQLLRMALRHGDWATRERIPMTATLGRTLGLLGRPGEAVKVLQQAIDLAPEGTRPDIGRYQVVQRLDAGDLPSALPQLEALQGEVGLPGFPSGLFAGGVKAWRRFQQRRRGDDFHRRLRTDIEPAQLVKVDVAWACVGPLARVDPSRAFAYQPTHLSTALDVGEVDRVVRALCIEAVVRAHRSADPDRAPLDRVAQLLEEHPSPAGDAWRLAAQAQLALLGGAVEEATQLAGEAEVRLRRAAMPSWQRHQQRAISLTAQVLSGQIGRIKKQVDDLVARADHDHHGAWTLELAGLVEARVRMATTFTQATRSRLASLLAHAPVGRPRALGQIALAELESYEGLDGCQRLNDAEAEASQAGLFDDALVRTLWWRALGLTGRAAGDERSVARAVAALRRDDRPWAEAWADLVEGRHAEAAEGLRSLGFGLELAAVGTYLDDGASAEWLQAHGVVDTERLVRFIAPA